MDTDGHSEDPPRVSSPRGSRQISLREILMVVTIVALVGGYLLKSRQLKDATDELTRLRLETGYLEPCGEDQVAAVRIATDVPLTYRFRVRTPEKGRYRIAYSSLLPKGATTPSWYSAIGMMPGESVVVIRIVKDPRDERWKIAVSVRGPQGSRRMATVLPPDHVEIFRQAHDVISQSIGYETVDRAGDQSIRMLDERWIVGENGLLLYGDRGSDEDLIGVYAELQPDVGAL